MITKFALVIGVAMLVYGCTASRHEEEARLFPGAKPDVCFPTNFIYEKRVLDSRRVVVRSKGERLYLIELGRPLYGLTADNMFSLIDGDKDGWICRSVSDRVMFWRDNASVLAVTRLDPFQIQALEQKYGVAALPHKQRPKDADALHSDKKQ